MYADDAAAATFEESERGSITPGKLADMVVLSGDPTRLPSNEIKDLAVEMTVLDGKIVWNRMIYKRLKNLNFFNLVFFQICNANP